MFVSRSVRSWLVRLLLYQLQSHFFKVAVRSFVRDDEVFVFFRVGDAKQAGIVLGSVNCCLEGARKRGHRRQAATADVFSAARMSGADPFNEVKAEVETALADLSSHVGTWPARCGAGIEAWRLPAPTCAPDFACGPVRMGVL